MVAKTAQASERAKREGYASGLEQAIARWLTRKGVAFDFESHVIRFVQPARKARYKPDFVLQNGIIVETKGRFKTDDRQKHLFIKDQHPDIDIRFVFSRSKDRISKQSKTTYAAWCEHNGFLYADKVIPEAWLAEPTNQASLDALRKAGMK